MGSRIVISNQDGLNDKLDEVVQKHLASAFRKPYQQHTVDAFEAVEAWRREKGAERPLVLDSCCGVGDSTARLALRHPEALVIGVDKSAHRINKHQHYASGRDNYLVVQADLDDFWRLGLDAGWRLDHHYLLYPNPWPKAKHLQRRWHGGPTFPHILALGGALELRSNWQTYVLEFARALALAGVDSRVQPVPEGEPITPFERKYQDSGQACWQLLATLAR
ncbi:SAM-dependent methyltransferase [Gallaecimonas sp. GXIMD4217]|uniref:tRNA (guanine(46)-N(7))-methyltransferase TrmB n=1 Tax=Gallaecimonas sp. GXIMD4217 TaxID=3131927 RepID=UPI00311AFCA1